MDAPSLDEARVRARYGMSEEGNNFAALFWFVPATKRLEQKLCTNRKTGLRNLYCEAERSGAIPFTRRGVFLITERRRLENLAAARVTEGKAAIEKIKFESPAVEDTVRKSQTIDALETSSSASWETISSADTEANDLGAADIDDRTRLPSSSTRPALKEAETFYNCLTMPLNSSEANINMLYYNSVSSLTRPSSRKNEYLPQLNWILDSQAPTFNPQEVSGQSQPFRIPEKTLSIMKRGTAKQPEAALQLDPVWPAGYQELSPDSSPTRRLDVVDVLLGVLMLIEICAACILLGSFLRLRGCERRAKSEMAAGGRFKGDP